MVTSQERSGNYILTQRGLEYVWDTTKDPSSKRRECLGFYSAGADRVCRRHALLPVRTHG